MSTGVLAGARNLASLVRLSHTVFALPFALLALLVATGGSPTPRLLLLVTLAVVAARTAAMAYNRFADRALDAANPRTAGREIPRGALKPGSALLLTALAGAAFVALCLRLGPWCSAGSVPVLAWLLAYSHTKRLTVLCHLWLGVALGLAPVAAWVAAGDSGGGVDPAGLWRPLLLGLGVTAWVAGFDVLYACQDEAFDRAHGLRSIPAALGARRALQVARLLHAAAVLLFLAFGLALGLAAFCAAGTAGAAALLLWQHRALAPARLDRIGPGLFAANGALSLWMLATGGIDLWILAR